MTWIIGLAIGLIAGCICGYSPWRLLKAKNGMLKWLIIALGCDLAVFLLMTIFPIGPGWFLCLLIGVKHGAVILMAVMTRPWHFGYLPMIAGAGMNLAAALSNLGKMPMNAELFGGLWKNDILNAMQQGLIPEWVIGGFESWLWWLGGWIFVPYPVPWLITPGDVLFILGLAWWMLMTMKHTEPGRGVYLIYKERL